MSAEEAYERPISRLRFPDHLSMENLSMHFHKALFIAERNLIDGATLDELKEAVRDLRALTPTRACHRLNQSSVAARQRMPMKDEAVFS
jgi:hypothetical protein